jgi:hypothetical protein
MSYLLICKFPLLFLQEDYRLLESMNRATITKYSDMKQIAGNVARTMIDLNEKCEYINFLVIEPKGSVSWIPNVGFEVFTAVVMKSIIFWDIMSCSPSSFSRRFRGTYRLHLQGRRNKFSKQAKSGILYHRALKVMLFFLENCLKMLWGALLSEQSA